MKCCASWKPIRVTSSSFFRRWPLHYSDTLSKIDDPYLRERALDIQDVTRRVIRNLQGKAPKAFLAVSEPHILVAHNLTPSDTATMDRHVVLGFATDLGSRTSHTAIMARSLNIPSVVGLHDVTEKLETGEQVLLDGYNGLLIIRPTPETLWHYGELESRKGAVAQQLTQLRETKSTTRDGRHIVLSANIELPDEVDARHRKRSRGRWTLSDRVSSTSIATSLPDEEEQYENYLQVAQRVLPHPLIIRTFDLGGDKLADGVEATDEMNPFLGCRAIRYSPGQSRDFQSAIARDFARERAGNVKIMFPMISGLGELREALKILDQCKVELRGAGQPFDDETEVGAMIEIPSAAISADSLAREVDFFSIGTNDLIQYAMAVDRVNERIAHLYEPTHPAVLRLLKMIADGAHANGIWVGVCGEMAGDIALIPLLLGLGMDELSASSSLVPRVKRAVQSLALAECEQLVAGSSRA